jgi:micrococcal nuclease
MKKLILVAFVCFSSISIAQEYRTYPGRIAGCYDGDTCTADFDLGMGVVLLEQKVRLYGIDAWELRGEEKEKGRLARDWINAQVKEKAVRIDVVQKSSKDAKGKYGRWIVVIWVDTLNINEELVKLGHAERASY